MPTMLPPGQEGEAGVQSGSAAPSRSLTTNVASTNPLVNSPRKWRREVVRQRGKAISKGLGHTAEDTAFSLDLFLMSKARSHCCEI